MMTSQLMPKRVQLLLELIPSAAKIGHGFGPAFFPPARHRGNQIK
jgi:hypothetical protein